MANPSDTLELRALAAASGAGSSSAVDIGAGRSAAFFTLRATVATAALSVQVQTSGDGSTGWHDVGESIAIGTTPGFPDPVRIAIDRLERYVRVTWPANTNATFEVTAVAHQLFAARADLYAKLDRAICTRAEQKERGVVARSLIEATDVALDLLGVGYTPPFTKLPESVVGAVAAIARLTVLEVHGFVGGGIDELAINGDQRARESLEAAAKNKAHIVGTDPEKDDGWAVVSSAPRRW